jgi:N-dimethylarginine dimethylaminohydrolase
MGPESRTEGVARVSPRFMHLDFAFTNLQKKLKMCYPMVLHLDFAICIT